MSTLGHGQTAFRLALFASIIATGAAFAQTTFPGLTAEYSDGINTVMTVVPTPNFYLEEGESIHPGLAPNFSATWDGFVEVILPGVYTFSIVGNGGTVSLNEEPVLGRSIELSAGLHPIRIHYERHSDTAQVRLEWSSEHFRTESVSYDRFSHKNEDLQTTSNHIERGRDLIESLGCTNCHGTDSAAIRSRMGADLNGVGGDTKEYMISALLQRPAQFLMSAGMPAMLNEIERDDVTAYLVSLSVESQPRIVQEEPLDRTLGQQHYLSLGCVQCHARDGVRPQAFRTDIATLADIIQSHETLDPNGGVPALEVSQEEALRLAAHFRVRPSSMWPIRPPGDVPRGKALIQSGGCLACHALQDPEPLKNTLTAPPLEALHAGVGCLADAPAIGLPRYLFGEGDRAALDAFLETYTLLPDKHSAPVYEYRRRVRQLRCTACHEFENEGPTVEGTETTPSLTIAADKLKTDWVHGVLAGENRVRAWIDMRMPIYKPEAVADLPTQMAKTAGRMPGDGQPAPEIINNEEVMGGIHMIGSDGSRGGLACISCHDWGDHASLGERGPQFINVTERVRFDWFGRWMHQPGRILSGTSMPTFFADQDPEDAEAAINTLWAALSFGESMTPPAGIEDVVAAPGSESMPLPVDEAVIIRWYMPEASPASIAVGLPNGVSYCFDAAECRVRYAWMGGFVDMTPALAKSAPPAKILGETFYRIDQFPFRIEGSDREPETKFCGYRIVDGAPEFHYEVDGISVYELITPRAQISDVYQSGPLREDTRDNRSIAEGIEHRFRIETVDRKMWYLPGAFEGTVITSDLRIDRNGAIAIPRGDDVKFRVTVINPKKQGEARVFQAEQKAVTDDVTTFFESDEQ